MPHTLITGPDGRKYQTYELTGGGVTREGESARPWRGFDPTKLGRHWGNSHAVMDDWDARGLIHWPKDGGFPRRRAEQPFSPEDRTVTVGDLWTDVDRINQSARERLGYPTQKPLALLERIIAASSNPGDIVLDPFCGCGTTIAAAQKLERRWIGIDVTHLALALMKYRLGDMFPDAEVRVIGEPEDVGAARQLASEDRYQFQWWALSLVNAKPLEGKADGKTGKKGLDRGIDGVISFIDDASGKPKRVLVQVKSGHVGSRDVRDLRGAVEREGAAIGVFLTLEPATREMTREAVSAGFYHSPGWGQDYPRIQVLTVEELLRGWEVRMPPPHGTFRQAGRVRVAAETQPPLELE